MMFRSKFTSGNRPGDAGFALPLALTVLVLLSYVIASGLQRVRVAQTDIRLAQANVRSDILEQNLEEDVVWRVLLEAVGRQPGFGFADEEVRYIVRAPQSSWRVDGIPFLWTPNYPNMTAGQMVPALVIVQDEVGKIDLNFRSRNFLSFLANRFEIPVRRRAEAVTTLIDYVESKTPSPIDIEARLELPSRTGIQDPDELCTLDIWNETDLCADRERLRSMFTGGLGMSPNITLSSPEIATFIFDGTFPDEVDQRNLEWEELQRRYGFYDVFGGIGAGGIKMSVTIIPVGSASALRFDVDARGPSDGGPFAVRMRRQVPAAPILAQVEDIAPDVVESFRSYSGVSEQN